jgi:HEAT repeat protein
MLEMWKQFKSIDRSKKQVVSLIVQGFMSGEEDYQRSLKQLKLMGPEAVPELIRHLIHSEEPTIRAGCAESLKLVGDQKALEPLLTMLVDPVASVRSEVAKAIAELKAEGTAAELLKELGRRSAKLDGYVLALGYMKEASAVEAVTKVLQSTSAPEDRAAAAFALGLIGDKASVQHLMDAVADNKIAMVRESACRALVRMGSPDSLPAVIKAIDRYPETRAELALQLRHWRDKRSIEALIELLRDPDKGVQDSAWDSLKILTGEAFGRDYEAWSSWWEVAKVEGMRF